MTDELKNRDQEPEAAETETPETPKEPEAATSAPASKSKGPTFTRNDDPERESSRLIAKS